MSYHVNLQHLNTNYMDKRFYVGLFGLLNSSRQKTFSWSVGDDNFTST